MSLTPFLPPSAGAEPVLAIGEAGTLGIAKVLPQRTRSFRRERGGIPAFSAPSASLCVLCGKNS